MVVVRVAGRQVGDVLRRLVRELTGGRVRPDIGIAVITVGLAAGAGLLTLQALRTGQQLGPGYGPGLIASIVSVAGVALGMTSLIGTHMWARSTQVERERLAVLPLRGWPLSLLAGTPSLLPSAVALTAATPSVVVLGLTTRIDLASLVGALTLGLALPLALGVVWTVPMLLLRPRRDLAVVVLVALSLGGLTGHAVWAASRTADDAGWQPNPVLSVLVRSEQYTVGEALATTVALGVSAALLLLVRRTRRRQQPRRRRALGGDVAAALPLPAVVRVWLGVVRVIWRQSSLVSELGVAVLLSGLIFFFASVAWAQGQEVYGRTAVFVAAGFGALPLLGVRSALGSTARLTQLGMRAGDIRAGLVGAGVLFHMVTMLPGLGILLWRGVSGGRLVTAALLTLVVFTVALSCGSVLRRVTATSVGRTVAVGVSMVVFYALLQAGLTSWPPTAIAGTALAGVAVLAGVLRFTVSQSSVA